MMSSKILERLGLAAAVVFLAAACSSTALRAPVESRTGAPAPTDTAPGAATASPSILPRPGFHVVKKGETLYSIALEYGQDYHDVAAWNNLDNPNVIQVGQELRVAAPESSIVTSSPVVITPSIEVTPVGPSQPVATTPNASSTPVATDVSGMKIEPKGGRIAYTPKAWADLQSSAKPVDVIPDQKPVTTASAPAANSPPVIAPAAASAPAVESKNGEDGIDWLWPANGKVIATFNDSTSKGVDLAGSLGDPVLATAAGKVIYVGSDLRGYGNLVIIKHNNLFLSAYAHNKEVLVKEGQAVQRGQKIATLGASDADRPKLHFEIRRQGKPVDPLKYLPKR